MTLCSWRLGWRSLLLRGYDEPEEVEELVTRPTADHLLVLVAEGRCRIEGRYAGRWQESHYVRGDIGMTAPDEEVHLRWRGGRGLKTLQLHLPAATLADIAFRDPASPREIRLPNQLVRPDPTLEAVLLSLGRAVKHAAPELYADTATHFLASHLLRFHTGSPTISDCGREPRRLAAVDALLRDSIGSDITLDHLASVAGLSKFHLLRVFRLTFGETPFQRLTRYRMEEAARLLSQSAASVSVIAFSCGYNNPTHFATAFRRRHGLSPRAYRERSKE
jgi:AraC family transcriptional regulator